MAFYYLSGFSLINEKQQEIFIPLLFFIPLLVYTIFYTLLFLHFSSFFLSPLHFSSFFLSPLSFSLFFLLSLSLSYLYLSITYPIITFLTFFFEFSNFRRKFAPPPSVLPTAPWDLFNFFLYFHHTHHVRVICPPE